MTSPTDTTERPFPDLYMGDTLLTVRLSKRAHDRYDAALWYVWGRQDAGDSATQANTRGHYLGDDFGFAEFAALEAESYHREQACSLSNIADQYARFLAS